MVGLNFNESSILDITYFGSDCMTGSAYLMILCTPGQRYLFAISLRKNGGLGRGDPKDWVPPLDIIHQQCHRHKQSRGQEYHGQKIPGKFPNGLVDGGEKRRGARRGMRGLSDLHHHDGHGG